MTTVQAVPARVDFFSKIQKKFENISTCDHQDQPDASKSLVSKCLPTLNVEKVIKHKK